MSEKPIVFIAPMVRAILNGRKTQTRRVIRKQPKARTIEKIGPVWLKNNLPPCWPGDMLWTKESWQYYDWTNDGEPFIRYRADDEVLLRPGQDDIWAERLSDIWAGLSVPENFSIDNRAADRRWRSPRFMPRWAARLFLRVINVRLERLQEISEEDAIAEGFEESKEIDHNFKDSARACFSFFWDSLNAKRGYPWDSNPWVWVIDFERIPE